MFNHHFRNCIFFRGFVRSLPGEKGEKGVQATEKEKEKARSTSKGGGFLDLILLSQIGEMIQF